MDIIQSYQNFGVHGSMSHSNLREVGIQKLDYELEVPSHYDVPRKIHHRRSQSCSNNTGNKILQFEIDSRGDSSSPTSEVFDPRSISAPSSPTDKATVSSSVMNNRDHSIYNSLGSSSSKEGKPSFTILGLSRNVKKTGIMSKTGPSPSWCAKWNRRVFVLKGNFLFYFDPVDKPIQSAPVLGGVYIKGSMVERISLPFTKRILKITPPVARRNGWSKDEENGVFYIKFRTEEGRDEWYRELMGVSLGHS